MNAVISQPMYFLWGGLFEQMRLADIYVHYTQVQYVRRCFMNSVQTKTRLGLTWTTAVLLVGFRLIILADCTAWVTCRVCQRINR